ncbi:hypothetical protein OS493_032073 [Desmophyllum pertusum]|uniref:Uncharacterized protein n=1 Tax=Desmophyllum pertusum TaxID=174260 RepID=A0A9W9YW32_9CNID|nr:hypothetical protein OS493_032073 [Desmophyllum pertusum]
MAELIHSQELDREPDVSPHTTQIAELLLGLTSATKVGAGFMFMSANRVESAGSGKSSTPEQWHYVTYSTKILLASRRTTRSIDARQSGTTSMWQSCGYHVPATTQGSKSVDMTVSSEAPHKPAEDDPEVRPCKVFGSFSNVSMEAYEEEINCLKKLAARLSKNKSDSLKLSPADDNDGFLRVAVADWNETEY